MKLKSLLDSLKNAVHDNSATQTWASNNYGRNHKVYVGIDARQPPGENDCPLVSIFPMGKVAGVELDQMEHFMGVTCVVFDDDLKTTVKTNLVEKESVGNLLDFVDLVRACILGITLTGLDVAVIDMEIDTIEAFPYMTASMEIKFTHDYYQGESTYFE